MNHISGYPFGKTLGSISLSGFTLTETAYTSHLKIPKHSHDQAYFCFVLNGNFTEYYGRHSRICRPSTLVFHPAEESHSDQFHTTTRCFNIQMNPPWFERVRRQSPFVNGPRDFSDRRLSLLAMQLYREFHLADNFSSLAIEGLLLEVIAEASRSSLNKTTLRPPFWLRHAREILDEQFSEAITLVALSELVGVHSVHLAREFRRFYHSTVGQYVRERRIEFACRQMSSTDASFSRIAHAAGFFDQSHFARTLKAFVGLTPTQYRAICKPHRRPRSPR